MDSTEGRERVAERTGLNAFISLTKEEGRGPVVAVKDLIDVAGTVTTAGGTLLPKTVADEDASVVKRIRRHECTIIGKTNLHEFAFGVTSVNPHYGAVRNPHDETRVAGGSSGGSAVAVAAGMCDWAIGTDTGGSIRIPAGLCGVVGFKPALGSIDTDGVIPLSRSLDTVGPIGPDVASVARAYWMMAGEAVLGPSLKKPRVAVPRGWVTDLDEATSRAWSVVSEGVPEVDFPDRDRLFRCGLTILLVEAAVYHRQWVATSPQAYGDDVLAHLRRGMEMLAVDYDEALTAWPELRAQALEAMDGIDALILPTTAITAPLISAGNEVREPLSRFTRPFNTTGQPVITLPAPVAGLPVGIQVVGRSNAEVIAAAHWLEAEWSALRS